MITGLYFHDLTLKFLLGSLLDGYAKFPVYYVDYDVISTTIRELTIHDDDQ